MNDEQKLQKLQKENEKLREKLRTLLRTYMMSEEVIDAETLMNELIENELQQEEMCNA